MTNYYEDLEDVIQWAGTQEWYKEPFCLVGHSLGGLAVGLYTARYPEKVKALAPISTVVSGKLSLTTRRYKENWKEWKKKGWVVYESSSRKGLIKRLHWAEMEDRLRYDLLVEAKKLTMPVLLIVGTEDEQTPKEHNQLLFKALPGRKEFHIIAGAPHTFQDPKHLAEIKEIFKKWIETLDAS